MVIEESGVEFEFSDSNKTVKFDDERFYKEMFNSFPKSKAVDFVELGNDFAAFIEVKNCLGDEGNCRWRIAPNNRKKDTSKTIVNVENRDSVDIEVVQKTAMTLAALSGATSFDKNKSSLREINRYAIKTIHDYLCVNSKVKYVILFLEGNFESHTRSKKMIMNDLQRSMKSKLKWMNCKVSVVDSDTYNPKIFKIKSCDATRLHKQV